MKFLLEGEETPRLRFRIVSNSDFDQWLEFFKDPSSFEHWGGQQERPEIECQKWFARQAERYEHDEGGMNALIEKQSGDLIGYSGLLTQTIDGEKELEVAYSLLPPYRNKGFATEAARKCIEVAFQNNLADSLVSIISLTNAASANVAIKNGMTVDKQTIYKNNPVNIFRAHRLAWLKTINRNKGV